jgi:2-oxoglutarate/2-oxoacid ferredoxin oxidoreductase subunit alpha
METSSTQGKFAIYSFKQNGVLMTKEIVYLEEATIRFAGDSGDGMQLVGTQFSDSCGYAGNEVNTFPDYPSEIRAPEGTLYGVSAFQIHFGAEHIHTTGDHIDVLFAMNASSLKVNLKNVRDNGLIIVDQQGFDAKNLQLAGYAVTPLDNGLLKSYTVVPVDFVKEIKQILKANSIDLKLARQIKNVFALGIAYWLFDRPMEPTLLWLDKKFKKKPEVLQANRLILEAGRKFAEESPLLTSKYVINKSRLAQGKYRNITGNHAVALGLVTAAKKSNLPLFLGSYPITPATEILQYISSYARYGVRHLQAEDEIAGITSAIGAAYGGSLAVTTTSGPGLSLKTEAIGLAIMTELPLIIVNVQRAGPSTGMPTKPEQSDLFQAFYGRHGEAPLCVLSASSPADCFAMTMEAARIALTYMTPVILLSDGYIGQSSEPWRIPSVDALPSFEPRFETNVDTFAPYKRDPETLARMWTVPGIKGLEHRIGGLEKADITGNVSHDPLNHEKMVKLRQEKIDRIADTIPLLQVKGEQHGEVLMISWGSTYGAAQTAFEELQEEGVPVSFVNLRYLNPFPKNLGEVLGRFKKIFIPELNSGQLKTIIQSRYLVEVESFTKVQGQLFKAREIKEKLFSLVNSKNILA